MRARSWGHWLPTTAPGDSELFCITVIQSVVLLVGFGGVKNSCRRADAAVATAICVGQSGSFGTVKLLVTTAPA